MAETRTGEAGKTGAIEFEGVTPILRVGSLAASLEYYVKVLGFKVDWQDPGIMASVSRGRCHIMLCEGDQGHVGGWVWIGVDAIEPLFAEYMAAGAKVRHAPTNYWWAYEMQIEDIDGNVLRLGAEPKDGVPMGEWLDGRGDVWVKSGTGAWTRKKIGFGFKKKDPPLHKPQGWGTRPWAEFLKPQLRPRDMLTL